MNGAIGGNFETFLSRIESSALRAVAGLWNEARGIKHAPPWNDIPFSLLSPYSNLVWVYAYEPKSGVYTGRFTGQRWGKWAGKDFHGRRLEDIHSPANYSNTHRLLTEVVTTPMACRSSGRLFKSDDFVVTGERIILPLAEDGQTANGVLGASDYVPPPLIGTLELILENAEWYAI
jgi:hypothetical protein